MDSNVPLFFNPGVVCKVLEINLREVRTLFDGGVLTGIKTPSGLRITSESLALYIAGKELRRKNFIWQKEGNKAE